jgi:chorismate mutase
MKLEKIRNQIDRIDRELLILLQERMGLSLRSKKFKKTISDPEREQDLLTRAEQLPLDLIEQRFTRQLLETIIQESKRLQKEDRELVAF